MKSFTSIISALGLVAALSACGTSNIASQSSSTAAIPKKSLDTVLLKPVVKVANGGINPDFGARVVSGQIQLGFNKCDATGVEAKLVQSRKGDTIIVTAQVVVPEQGHACTEEFNPQFVDVSTLVMFNGLDVKHLIIKNANSLGNDLDILL